MLIPTNDSFQIATVVIGRNEGERLRACISSAIAQVGVVVYVDSGSTDDSVTLATDLGAIVVSLDMSIPFTAARARNAGYRRAIERYPSLRFVQFVDGDCEIVSGWISKAATFLAEHQDVAVVCGRRRERYPHRSVYNMICDIEWDSPIGEARACGGDALMRVDALVAVDGYRADLIAGEEPELCVRLRSLGWRVWRIDEEMTLHDVAMTRFVQWFKRTLRAGHAFAQGTSLHGKPPESHFVRESRSAWVWGLGIPVVTCALVKALGSLGWILLLAYPLQVLRLALRGKRSAHENWWYAFFIVLGKFPEMCGQIKFLGRRWFGGEIRLIEYK